MLLPHVNGSCNPHLTAGESAGFFGAQISGKLVSLQKKLLMNQHSWHEVGLGSL